MAIYHANIKNLSKSKGDSSIAAAAYRAGLDLIDTKTRDWHRYSQRRGVAAVRMLAPAGSPDWCNDPCVFWDANQQGEARKNALVARELEVSLPHELDGRQRETLAVALGQLLVDRYQCVVMVAIHEPVNGSDTRNHHTHLLISARQVGPGGLGVRACAALDARGGKGAEEVRAVRALVSNLINDHLVRAGVDQAVDHRSLKDQASAAIAKGDHQLAIRLTRPPTKHVGKFATHVLGETAETQMDEAMAKAAARGVLVATPAQHSHSAAMAERIAARRASPPQKAPVVWGRATRPARAGQSSYTALRLGRLGRITRAQGGSGADVLNMEAELIEQWLASQVAAAEAALESAQEIPGIRLEPVFVDALASLRTRRVAAYGTKPFLFENTEALSWSIQNYAAELRRPHDNRQRLAKAMAHLSVAENPAEPAPSEEILRARRELSKAQRGVSDPALIECERRLNQARELMKNAREGIERDFHITKVGPIEPDPFGAFPPEEGGQRKSDSNRRELKPSSRPRA